ncbi:MAG: hypothetical protein ACLQGM_01345, partial [Methanoregula sp.]
CPWGVVNGIEAARLIRHCYDGLIIFLTAYLNKEKIDEAKSISPSDFLNKPYLEHDLLAVVEKAFFR